LEEASSATTPRASRMGVVLGSLAALLITASAILLIVAVTIHYFAEHRTGTEVTLESGSRRGPEASTVAGNPRTPDNSEKPGSPTTSPQQLMLAQSQSSLTSEAQRSSSAPPPPRAPNTAAAPPAATTTAGATPTGQPAVRDRAAALPDPPAVTPKKENVFIVLRGPANIRSDHKKGRVIGAAPKNATVKALDRVGNWVQVETEAGTGWINAALLASPESR
jgi:Bacterial SH3 domain